MASYIRLIMQSLRWSQEAMGDFTQLYPLLLVTVVVDYFFQFSLQPCAWQSCEWVEYIFPLHWCWVDHVKIFANGYGILSPNLDKDHTFLLAFHHEETMAWVTHSPSSVWRHTEHIYKVPFAFNSWPSVKYWVKWIVILPC